MAERTIVYRCQCDFTRVARPDLTCPQCGGRASVPDVGSATIDLAGAGSPPRLASTGSPVGGGGPGAGTRSPGEPGASMPAPGSLPDGPSIDVGRTTSDVLTGVEHPPVEGTGIAGRAPGAADGVRAGSTSRRGRVVGRLLPAYQAGGALVGAAG